MLPFPEGIGFVTFFAVTGAVSGFELELLALDADRGAGRNGMGDEDIGADDAVPADDCAAAKNGGACIDGHMVFNGGMALLAFETLTAPGGEGA